MTLSISAIQVADGALGPLVERALSDLRSHRGGAQLENEILALLPSGAGKSLVDLLLENQCVQGAYREEVLAGILVCSLDSRCIVGIYVDRDFRRQGVAQALVRDALGRDSAPVDAWVLPGDRAMKSLFESAGWKARRLTMSDGAKGFDEPDERA